MALEKLFWGVKWLLGITTGGRTFPVFPDDTFLVSFPRSGNTWTRFLLAHLIRQGDPVSFKNIESIIPDVNVNSRRFLMAVPRPRLVKTHEPFESSYKKVLYIVRDPRDVAVSLYHWLMKRTYLAENYPVDRYVERFIAAEFEGTAGSWGENVATWLAARGNDPNFLLLRYEDLLASPQRELAKAASFLGIQAGPAQLQQAVELSSADHMRALEKKQANIWVTTKKSRQDIPFVRKAASGGWKSDLPEESVAQIESAWGPLMAMLGYDLVTGAGGSGSTRPQWENELFGSSDRVTP